MLKSVQPKSIIDRFKSGSFFNGFIAALIIFFSTLLLVMLFGNTPITRLWIVGLLGLAALLPHLLWFIIVLFFSGRTLRLPWPLVISALAWGSLISSTTAIFLETVSGTIINQFNVPYLGTMIVAPFWEEFVKGLFIALLYFFAHRHLRNPWNGLVYGVLVGAGFGFTEDLVNLLGNLDNIADMVSAYLIREIFMAHLHSMFTGVTGLAAGIAARQGLPPTQAFRWIIYGFLIAFTMHAIFDSATVIAEGATLILGPIYAGVYVIMLRQLHRREKVITPDKLA